MTDDEIRHTVQEYIITAHAPDLRGERIPDDYDVIRNGVVDSLALIELVEWVQATWSIPILDSQISPDSFRTIAAITEFIATRVPAVGTHAEAAS